jgi:hypothetical protein
MFLGWIKSSLRLQLLTIEKGHEFLILSSRFLRSLSNQQRYSGFQDIYENFSILLKT